MFGILKDLGSLAISIIGVIVLMIFLFAGSFIVNHWEVILGLVVIYFFLRNTNSREENSNLVEDNKNLLSKVARKLLVSYDRYKFLTYTSGLDGNQKAAYLDTGSRWENEKQFTFIPMIMIEQGCSYSIFNVVEILIKMYLDDDGIHLVYLDVYEHFIDTDLYVVSSTGKYFYDSKGEKEIFSTNNFKIRMHHRASTEEGDEELVVPQNDPAYSMLLELLNG